MFLAAVFVVGRGLTAWEGMLSRFNTATRLGVRSPIVSTTPARTALGGAGFERDTRSELFLLAVSNMVNPGGLFHEDGQARDDRFVALLREVAADTAWVSGFVGFLRNDANMRSASIIAAAEIVKARLDAGLTGSRGIVSAALQRADEPGEFLAYWISRYGRKIPKPVKRGLSDAIGRLWNERAYLKWDSDTKDWRFADILQIVHPKADHGWRHNLYHQILTERYNPDEAVNLLDVQEGLPTLRAHRDLMAVPVAERTSVTTGQLAEAGMTWESYAGWVQGPMNGHAWDRVIPLMGYAALLRNLRNFDQALISKDARREVEDKLTDPEQVAKSRQLPMRFLSAYRATRESGTVTAWGPVIEEALNLSLANVPVLSGRTLVLVDLSGSMYQSKLSDRSDLRFVDAAAVFGAALAKRSEHADLIGFGTTTRAYPFNAQSSLLPLASAMTDTTCVVDGYYGRQDGLGGTDTVGALRSSFRPGFHDRIVIVTDEQYQSWGWSTTSIVGDVNSLLDSFKVPAYTWNLAGYKTGQSASGGRKRHTFGGLSDASFKQIKFLEAGSHSGWTWESGQ